MKRSLLAALLCGALTLSGCGAAPAKAPVAPEETGQLTSETEETIPEEPLTEMALEESVTEETAPEESVTEITSETASEILSGESEVTEAVPDTDAVEGDKRPFFVLPGTWYADEGGGILTIYENGGFELTDMDSFYEGYLLYTEEDGNLWESGPRYELYLENNERLPNAFLTWDDEHPGKLVYALGGGAELFSRGDAAYDTEGIAVRVRWAEDTLLSVFPEYDEFDAYSGDYEADIFFTTERTLPDFKFLSVSFEEVDDNGAALFSVAELYRQEALTPEHPLLVRTSFPGDMPTNGICYTDESGLTRYFSVSESGFDGSLTLSEFQRSGTP